ncbi:hypothetical protein Tco_0422454 [Tanacetum coccineum]
MGLDTWFELIFHENLVSAGRVDPLNVCDTPCDRPFMIPKDFKEPGNSFNSILGGSKLDGFNRFSGAFHSSDSTGSVLGLDDLEVRSSYVDHGGDGKGGSWVLTPDLVVMAKVGASGCIASEMEETLIGGDMSSHGLS